MTEKNMTRDLKCSRVARTLWPQSTEQQKIQVVDTKKIVCITKSAVRDFVLFMKSVYLTVHFGCIFFFVKPRAFCSALFFSDLNIKAWNVINIIISLAFMF